jgi:dihydroorotate dehydrogenase electron transfer subunit
LKHHLIALTETRPLWADWHLLTFDAPDLARSIRPGQFALARDPAGSTLDPYLRRTLWLYEIRDARVSFILNAHDPLARSARVGAMLDVLAPLGHALTFEPSARHILLLGQGSRTAPLIGIAHEAVKLGREVVVVTSGEKFPSQLLAPEIELRHDESFDAELIAWAHAIVASGAADYYRGLSDAIRAVRLRIPPGFARVWLEMPMPCGTGICYACAVDTHLHRTQVQVSRGIRLACVDGPAMDLVELERSH